MATCYSIRSLQFPLSASGRFMPWGACPTSLHLLMQPPVYCRGEHGQELKVIDALQSYEDRIRECFGP